MKSLLWLLTLFFALAFNLLAQNEKQIDSLRNAIDLAEGKAKIAAMAALFRQSVRKDPRAALRITREMEAMIRQNQWEEEKLTLWDLQVVAFQLLSQFDSLKLVAQQGIQLSLSMSNDSTLGQFYKAVGIYHEKAGSLDSAIYYYNEALTKRGANQLALYNNIGLAYNRSGSYLEGIQYLEKAIVEAQQTGNINAEAVISNNIGSAHRTIGNPERAIEFYLKSLELKEQLGDERGKLFALLNLVRVQEADENMKQYLQMGLEIAEKLQDPFFLPEFKTNQALLLLKEGKNQEGLEIGFSIYKNAQEGKNAVLMEASDILALGHINLKEYQTAKKYGLEMLALATKQQSFHHIQLGRERLLEIYKQLGEYDKYIELVEAYFPAKDSLAKKASLDQLAYLDNQLKNVEQEKEIEALNTTLEQRRIRRNWLLGVSLLIAFTLALIIYFRSRQVKAQKKLLLQEQKTAKELEKVNQELKNIDEMKTRFFTNISHELRTPVTLISTPVEQILRKHAAKLGTDVKSSLSIVRNNSKKLLSLIEELLELSRIDAGKKELETSPNEMATFFRQLFSAYETAAQLKQIDYQLEYGLEEEVHLLIDPKKMEKIINNLLANALKFTPNQGSVKLFVNQDASKQNLLVQVTDTGRGIGSEDLPHVFDRYFQTRRKDLPTEGGTGIGLALSRELATLLGGSLTVTSEQGQGSTFQLRLPADEVTPESKTDKPIVTDEQDLPIEQLVAPVVTPSLANADQQGKILIVEDNPDMQQLILSLLSEDYDCLLTNNGAEAWNLLTEQHESIKDIDLILSDVMMPQMDGYTLLNHLKNDPKWQQYPVIMLTARAAEEDKLQALRMGVDDYLTKPFSPEELLVRTQNLIHNYRQRLAFKAANPVDLHFEPTSSADQNWLKELEEATLTAIDKKLELKANHLASEMALSSRQLLRRLKSLTGLSTTEYIQEVKLQKARHLLENRTYPTMSEVAFAAGFSSASYFTTLFKKQYGKNPSEWL